MKKLLILLLSGCATASYAQETDEPLQQTDTTKAWTAKGNVAILVNQSTFSNWAAGGENNVSGTASINYDFNYKKDNVSWDNKIIASYGLVKTNNSPFEKKTDDRLEFNSLLGKKFKNSERWYYSAFLNFRTQFTKGYLYGTDANGAEVRAENTRFMSPGYLQFGPGVLWKKDDNLKFNLAPATSKLTFVDKSFTSGPGYVDGTYFGVDAGKGMRYELGFHASGYYKAVLMANVSFENILSAYSNYLEDPQNVDLDYQLNIVMKVNKYLSTNLSFQAIYDDNAFNGFQIRQVLGVGVNFGI